MLQIECLSTKFEYGIVEKLLRDPIAWSSQLFEDLWKFPTIQYMYLENLPL